MNADTKTLVVITGGTIDAMYSPEEGTPYLVPVPRAVADSSIPAALERLHLSAQCDIWPLAMIDSKSMPDTLLDTIFNRIVTEGYLSAVIVHGTDTITRSGCYLKTKLSAAKAEAAANLTLQQCRMVLTGAMYPLRDDKGAWRGLGPDDVPILDAPLCDGWGNLARALADGADTRLAPGVYVRIGVEGASITDGPFDPGRIEKHVETEVSSTHEEEASRMTVKRSYFRFVGLPPAHYSRLKR